MCVQMHNLGFVDPEDMNVTSGKRKFTSLVGYTSSKLAQVFYVPHFKFQQSPSYCILATLFFLVILTPNNQLVSLFE